MPQRLPGARPKPIEEHRRVHAGHRPLPEAGTLVPLAASNGVPKPMRELGPEGQAMWDRVWNSGAVWLADRIDADTILVLCEMVDERQELRRLIFENPQLGGRPQLRALEKSILDTLGFCGFNPSDRKRLAVAEVVQSPLDDMMERRRAARAGGE